MQPRNPHRKPLHMQVSGLQTLRGLLFDMDVFVGLVCIDSIEGDRSDLSREGIFVTAAPPGLVYR